MPRAAAAPDRSSNIKEGGRYRRGGPYLAGSREAVRGLRTDRTAEVIIAGHAFMQNLRRGHHELGIDVPPTQRVAAAFTELARAI